MGRYRSGQTGQTVNLLAHAFAGSNPALPTILLLKRIILEPEDPWKKWGWIFIIIVTSYLFAVLWNGWIKTI
jgi:hypothetical protein